MFKFIVTMKWWNDLWLNEGFATFMEYKAVADRYPTGEMVNIELFLYFTCKKHNK